MNHGLLDTPRVKVFGEGQEKSLDLSKELTQELFRCGMLRAMVSLRSARFRSFLKRPALLLRDDWSCEMVEGCLAAQYTLKGARGAVQTIRLHRSSGRISLTTECPSLDMVHEMVYCSVEKRLISNEASLYPRSTPT